MKHSPGPHDEDVAERLEVFVDLLLKWNARINLVAASDVDMLWPRHVCDSAQLAPLLPKPNGTLVDLGSGAGFPGLVLSVVSGWRAHLVEADHRKAAFLREAVRATSAAAVVHAARAESLRMPPVDVVVARALASLPVLLSLAAPLLHAEGICLFLKGRTVDRELTVAANTWQMRVERFPSRTSPAATILRISGIRRVGPTS